MVYRGLARLSPTSYWTPAREGALSTDSVAASSGPPPFKKSVTMTTINAPVARFNARSSHTFINVAHSITGPSGAFGARREP